MENEGTHPVLHIVNVVDGNLFIQFDVVNRAYVVGLRVVKGTRREGLHVHNLRRVVDLLLYVKAANLFRLLSLIAPVLRVVIVFNLLVFVHEAAPYVLKRQVRDVGDSSSVEAPVHFESEAALYLKIKASLTEFVVQVPLVESEAAF
jgi:hypothetical protein